jgi:hypothetical protein
MLDLAQQVAGLDGLELVGNWHVIQLCQMIGQDAIALEALWTPLKQARPDGSVGLITDRSIKTRADLNRIIWPGEAEIEERLRYVREYVDAAKGTGVGLVFLCASAFQTLYSLEPTKASGAAKVSPRVDSASASAVVGAASTQRSLRSSVLSVLKPESHGDCLRGH